MIFSILFLLYRKIHSDCTKGELADLPLSGFVVRCSVSGPAGIHLPEFLPKTAPPLSSPSHTQAGSSIPAPGMFPEPVKCPVVPRFPHTPKGERGNVLEKCGIRAGTKGSSPAGIEEVGFSDVTLACKRGACVSGRGGSRKVGFPPSLEPAFDYSGGEFSRSFCISTPIENSTDSSGSSHPANPSLEYLLAT